MKFFIDTANVNEIREVNDMGIICGVTTSDSRNCGYCGRTN